MKKAIHSGDPSGGDEGRISDICEPGQEFPINPSLEWIDVADDTTTQDTWDGTQVVKFVPHVPDYAKLRRKAYGSWGDQFDQQFHDLIDDTTTWQDHVASVKAAHPKPK